MSVDVLKFAQDNMLLLGVAIASGFLVGVDPRYQIFDAAGIFDSIPHGHQVMTDPEVQKRMTSAGIVKPRQTGSAFLQKYLAGEIEKWGDILRTTKDTD